jgi:protein involved in polysaccharide export with SLBB domain
MTARIFLPLVAAAVLALEPTVLRGQARPTPAQAQALLQARPELVQQLRQRVITSGMTPEQVRARLRAEGYPENLLDAYLPGSTAQPGVPNDEVFGAIRRLGIAEPDDIEMMRTMLREDVGSLAPAPLVRDDTVNVAPEDSAEVLFGLSMFRNATSEFLPTMDGPVDANYRLGPGDQLVLILTGEVELAHTLDVTREGFIVIPQVGQMGVANLTMAQLEDLLYARLSRSYSGIRRGANAPTRFSVSVSRLRAIQVFVTGDVVRPSSYRISSAGTAMTALYAAGGPTENGSLREVTVRRAGQVVGTLDVYDYLLRGDNSGDVRLENGDVLFVRTHGPRVRVAGEVLRPATYELLPTETVRDAVRAAGGFKPTAQTNRVQIQRIVPAADRTEAGRDRVVIDVPAGPRVEDLPALSIEGGDVLRVFAVSERVRNRVTVSGHVWTPGAQALTDGMTLSQALRNAGGLKSDAYLGQVLVTRLRADSTRAQLRATALDTTGAIVNDFALQEDDEVQVFSVTEFRPERYVAIGGSVRRGGRFPWREGMTLRDLVLLGGGLREGAYLREAELARLPRDRRGGVTATTVRVPLDSSYLADYVPGQPYAGAPGQASPAYGASPEVVLEPYDNVLILEQPDWQLQRTVWLTGEVRFPGRYALKTKNERLSDIIAHAGGLTDEADAEAAYFSRVKAATAFASDTLELTERVRVGVSLEDALRRPRGNDNLVLIDRDSLHVPFRRTTVEIQGAVNAPTAIAVNGSQSIRYYLRAAGGASSTGAPRNAYVIQPNGKIESRSRFLWIVPIDPTPRAGATVVVPAKPVESRTSERIATVAIIAQAIASLAAVVAILR